MTLSYRHARKEQGASLIIVLIILIIITLLGALATKQGLVNLNLSTSTQARRLLTQSSDVPLARLEKVDAGGEIANLTNPIGPLGYLRMTGHEADEYLVCYRPMKSALLFNATTSMYLTSSGGKGGGDTTNGSCNVAVDADYTSARGTVLTQLAFTRPGYNTGAYDAVNLQPFEAADKATDNSSINKPDPVYYRVYTNSIIPGLSVTASDTAINTCMQKPTGGQANPKQTDATKTDYGLPQCLRALSVPVTVQVQDYVYTALPKRSS